MKLLAGVLLGVAIIAFAVALLRSGRAAGAWQEFAHAHGFRIEGRTKTQPIGRVVGEFDDCPVRLEILTTSDLHRTRYRSYTKMSVWIDGAPSGLSVTERMPMPKVLEGFTSKLRGAVGVPTEIESEDDEFHASHSVRGDDARRVLAWLTPSRRRVLREFCADDGYLVTGSAVAWTDRFAPTSVRRLEEIYARLTEAARALGSLR